MKIIRIILKRTLEGFPLPGLFDPNCQEYDLITLSYPLLHGVQRELHCRDYKIDNTSAFGYQMVDISLAGRCLQAGEALFSASTKNNNRGEQSDEPTIWES